MRERWKWLTGRLYSNPLSTEDLNRIDTLLQNQSGITLQGIIDMLQQKVSEETVRKAVLKLSYVYKKKSLHASEQEWP